MALPLGIVGMSMQTPENMSVFRYNPYPFFTFARCSMSRGHCLNGEKRVVLVLKESEAMILSRVAKVAVVIALLSSLSGCWMFFPPGGGGGGHGGGGGGPHGGFGGGPGGGGPR
ncbi:hypothetical protein PUP75_20925 [Pseudomonas chlororaphis]|uniref:hypothetical protein n=2 Tax=Pseudomonas TaxID=286 RepID=UPI002367574A|nr:hypothetical protein [Pseudomonas chlororaphis]WDH51398.1 hypothetical protein PUP75_20925 [Pseudomonas chlororaphis]